MRKNIITILIIFLTVYICSGKENNTAEHYFKTGEDFYKTYDFENAINAYNKAIEINPSYAPAYESKGWAMSKINNPKEMVFCFDKASEIYRKQINLIKTNILFKDAQDYFSRGMIYLKEKRSSEALTDFSTAISIDKNYIKPYYYRGIINSQYRSNFLNAIKDFDKVLDSSPESAEVYYNRGVCYTSLNEHQRAISDYSQCIKLKSNYMFAYINRGNEYQALGDYKNAIADLSKAIEIDPKSAMTYNNRGTFYYYISNYKYAKQDFEKAIKLDPNGMDGKQAINSLKQISQRIGK